MNRPSYLWLGLFPSLLAFLVFAFDKWAARRGRRRVPERTLLLLAALGGAPGAWAAMYLFRHKTRKPVFFVGVPLLLLLQAGLLAHRLGLL